jgi:hypothetical protein
LDVPRCRRRLAVALALSFFALSCGSKSPTEPGDQGRAAVNISGFTVTGSQTATGYRYSVRLTVQNTGAAQANLDSLKLSLLSAGRVYADITLTDAFANTNVAPDASMDSRTMNLTDDEPGAPFAESIAAVVIYRDSAGGLTATRTVSVPPLTTPPAPQPPQTFTLSGTVRESGGGALGGAEVEVIYSSTDRIKFSADGSGRYSRSGLSGGNITVRASQSGYATQEQSITLSANRQLDFSLQKGSPTPPPPPQPSVADVEYLVTGQRSNIITIANEGDGVSQFGPVNLPWSYKFANAVPAGQFLYVSAQNDLDHGCIKVQIFRRGALYKESESCGAYVIASASGSR